jgi:hypothetical protein
MTSNRFLIGATLAVLAAGGQAPAVAHEGEDHGAAPPSIAQTLLPRTEATTELFELVGVIEPGRLLIYLDRHASNAPVEKALIEVEGAGMNAVAVETAAGVYAVTLAQPLPAGQHALSFTVQDGDNADLLAATLDLTPTRAPTVLASTPARWWAWVAGAGAVSAAGFGILVLRRRKQATSEPNSRIPS